MLKRKICTYVKKLSYGDDAIDYIFADTTPHERIEILFVVEFNGLAATAHE